MNSRSSSMYKASKGAQSSSTKEGIQQRIAAKQQEYEALSQLKMQSASLLRSMQDLESKLDTLNGGTEAVASVLSNWANVFKAINMSTVKMQATRDEQQQQREEAGDLDGEQGEQGRDATRPASTSAEMPETLVRIATQKSSLSS